jgi:hypothetical protein
MFTQRDAEAQSAAARAHGAEKSPAAPTVKILNWPAHATQNPKIFQLLKKNFDYRFTVTTGRQKSALFFK